MDRKHLDVVAGGSLRTDFVVKIRFSVEEFSAFSMSRLRRYNMAAYRDSNGSTVCRCGQRWCVAGLVLGLCLTFGSS